MEGLRRCKSKTTVTFFLWPTNGNDRLPSLLNRYSSSESDLQEPKNDGYISLSKRQLHTAVALYPQSDMAGLLGQLTTADFCLSAVKSDCHVCPSIRFPGGGLRHSRRNASHGGPSRTGKHEGMAVPHKPPYHHGRDRPERPATYVVEPAHFRLQQ